VTLKIGHVSLCYRPITGGQERYIEALKQVLEHMGHQSTVYQSLSLRQTINRTGVDVSPALPLLPRLVPNLGWYFFNLCLRMKRRRLRREDLLIVHYAVHTPPVRSHPNVIVVSHGIEWWVPPRNWDDRVRAARARDAFKRFTLVANDTDYLRHCGVDIKPGARMFEEIEPGKWFIPNCIDTAHFRRVAPDARLAALNPIVVPRNIYFHRGIHLAIDAYARLVRQGRDGNHLVVVGAISNRDYYRSLLRLIDELGVKERVHFWGPADRADMPAIYSAARCTVIPSIFSEGTSLSAIESMACGTPVVATDVGGLRDLPVVHTSSDPEAFAAGIARVLDDRDRYAAEQEHAARSTFNLENWERAWGRVIARAAAAAA
jgi:glycosyltransferase involved in cell wall biosynthesis